MTGLFINYFHSISGIPWSQAPWWSPTAGQCPDQWCHAFGPFLQKWPQGCGGIPSRALQCWCWTSRYKNNCQFAMDHHKNKTFKNIISWWQLSVFWDFARLLKPIIVNLYVDYFDDLFFSKCHCLGLKHSRTLAFWPQRHLLRSTASAWRHTFLKNSSLEKLLFLCISDRWSFIKKTSKEKSKSTALPIVPMHIQKSLEMSSWCSM